MAWTDLRLTNPITGSLLSEWRFSEGSGTTVADSVGANPINLATPTTPNYTWSARGISLASGLVQTPSITGARTVALLYKVGVGESAGFILSGGSASGSGVQGEGVTITYSHNVGVARGMKPLLYRSDTGGYAKQLNRGNWVLLITDFATAYNTILGIGGRHSTTTSRCTSFEVAYCAVYSGTLVAAERHQIYEMARQLASSRSFYIDWRDCPAAGEVVMLNGQSNGEGRALLSNLSGPDAARTTPNTYILRRNDTSVSLMVKGTNQQTDAPTTQFGPELGLAWAFEDTTPSTDLYISKFAVGSTYLATTAGTDWNVNEFVSGGNLYQALINLWTLEASMLNAGVGPRLRGMAWMQGEQDATADAYSVLYAANLKALIDKYREQVSDPAAKFVIARIRDQDPSFDATAIVQVRLFQEIVGESDSNISWFDTDTMTLKADLVHYDAAGQKALGQALYAQFFPSTVLSGSLPVVGQVASGIDRGDGQLGTRTDAPVATVLSTQSYGAGGTGLTGTYVAVSAANVRSGTAFGAASALTGVFAAPTAAQVLNGIGFGANVTEFTGTVVLPAVSNVKSGVTFGPSSGSAGTFTVPQVYQVLAGVPYGAGGTELTGTMVSDDWTSGERAQIRYRLGIDGASAVPTATGHAELDTATQAQIDAIEASTAGTVSGAGTGTEIFVGTNVTLTITVDADGNRSSVVVS